MLCYKIICNCSTILLPFHHTPFPNTSPILPYLILSLLSYIPFFHTKPSHPLSLSLSPTTLSFSPLSYPIFFFITYTLLYNPTLLLLSLTPLFHPIFHPTLHPSLSHSTRLSNSLTPLSDTQSFIPLSHPIFQTPLFHPSLTPDLLPFYKTLFSIHTLPLSLTKLYHFSFLPHSLTSLTFSYLFLTTHSITPIFYPTLSSLSLIRLSQPTVML